MFNKNLIVAVLALMFTLSGCASNSSASNKAKVDPTLTNEETSFFNESGATACIVGGLAGGIIGAFVGSNSNDKAAYIIGGAAVGCAGAMGINYALNNVRTKYKTKEQQLMATITIVEEDNAKLQKKIDETKAVMAKQEQQLADLDKQVVDKAARQQEVNNMIASSQANIQYLQKQLAAAQKNNAEFTKQRDAIMADTKAQSSSVDKKALAALNEKIAQNEKLLHDLEDTLSQYAALENGLHVDDTKIAA